MLRKLRVAVLMGGVSAEREVSLKSGAAVSKALRTLGHEVTDIDAGAGLCEALRIANPEVVFIALHGGWGEDGAVQGLLEVMGLPYTGSGVMASALAMDKLTTKRIFREAGVPVPEFEIATSADAQINMALPVVVKPSREGSSIGVSIVKDKSQLREALIHALKFDGPALLERYIKGKEVQIGVLGRTVLGGVEVRPKAEFYSFEAKYTAGMTEYILPPELPADDYERAKAVGLRAHEALGCKGASRVDLIVTPQGDIYALEVNTIPGMTETSLLPKIARLAGIEFPELLQRSIDEAMQSRSR